MNRAAFLLMALIISIGADQGGMSAVSADAKEGKNVYVPLTKPIDLQEEGHIQERDQNTTRQSVSE